MNSKEFSINNETMKDLINDKNCRHFIHMINNSNRNRIVSKYTYRLYSYIKKKYNCKHVNMSFGVLEVVKLRLGSRFKIITK